jgi:hypothetical protein
MDNLTWARTGLTGRATARAKKHSTVYTLIPHEKRPAMPADSDTPVLSQSLDFGLMFHGDN